MFTRVVTLVTVFVGLCLTPALAQFDSGSDGSDGILNPQSSSWIDLSLAATGSWDMPSPVPGRGVYDPDKWAVVFKYASIDIPPGMAITFANHPSGAPVVWLVDGDVYIGDVIYLHGGGGDVSGFSVPGPGGFGGGRGGPNTGYDVGPSGGFGPGGGGWLSNGATYATGGPGAIYGNQAAMPLIGGSGGKGTTISAGGGAGAGSILIAASGDLVLDGSILANGGPAHPIGPGGSGSGGSIRLIANNISGFGVLRAKGGFTPNAGGDGRIRVEAAQSVNLDDPGDPLWTTSTPGPVFPPAGSPTLRAASVNATGVPTDPNAGIMTTDLEIATDQPVTISIEATNIPVGTTVTLLIVREHGDGTVVATTSSPLVDVGGGLLVATATATLPTGRSEIQLRANWTP